MSRKTLVILIMALLIPAAAQAQRLVFIVRHAERADGNASMLMGKSDPPLSEMGRLRAARLAEMLRDAGIQSIYTTEFRRTQETAMPLATELKIKPMQIPMDHTKALIESLRTKEAGKIVLVVGHSNTIPSIVRDLGGPKISIEDKDYDNLFLVVPASGTMTRILFSPK